MADSNVVYVNGSPHEVKHTDFNATASGDNTIVAAVTGKKIRVLEIFFTAGEDQVIDWKSGSGTTDIADTNFATQGGLNSASRKGYVYETDAGEAFVLNLSAAGDVSGSLSYIEVD